MGRGRQKAKQTKIARKLKYLTTDTDYDELAKELSGQEKPAEPKKDAFATVDKEIQHDQELDEYAKWAAEAAAKAEQQEQAKKHKPIPIPVPSAIKSHKPVNPLAAVAQATVGATPKVTKKTSGKSASSEGTKTAAKKAAPKKKATPKAAVEKKSASAKQTKPKAKVSKSTAAKSTKTATKKSAKKKTAKTTK